jgi:hypothetical protein
MFFSEVETKFLNTVHKKIMCQRVKGAPLTKSNSESIMVIVYRDYIKESNLTFSSDSPRSTDESYTFRISDKNFPSFMLY